MELDAEELSLIERFREHAADKRRERREAEAAQLERDEKKHKEEHRKREEKEETEREATTAQIAVFTHALDSYDTATVQALMINQERLDAVRLRLDHTEATAFHLDDGRAVFRTADGRHVYDKTGAEVPRETVRPEDIPKSKPTWEVWQSDKTAERDLLKQRDEIHAFQHRLDQAREQSGQKGVSADALAKLDADLKASMPQAVRDARANPGGMPDGASIESQEAQRAFQPFNRPSPAPIARPSPM